MRAHSKIRGSLRFLQIGLSPDSRDKSGSLDCVLNIRLEVSCLAEQYALLAPELAQLIDSLDKNIANETTLFEKEKTLTPEVLTLRIYEYLKSKVQLDYLALRSNYESQKYIEIDSHIYPAVRIGRSYVFNSLHRHYNTSLGPEENAQIYRKCSNIHGHEYFLTIIAEGELSESGSLLDDNKWEDFVKSEIIEPFHGKLLNDVIGNTSGETLLLSIGQRVCLYGQVGVKWHYRLQETHRNSFYL